MNAEFGKPFTGRVDMLRKCAVVVVLFVVLCWSGVGYADDASSMLKVISYNIQFLPGIGSVANKRKQPEYRAGEIGRLMADYDLVGLNEAFEDKARTTILDRVKESWGEKCYVITGPKPTDGRYNGGLALLSRFPFLTTHAVIYTVSSSPKDYGLKADGFVAKGVLHARIWRGGNGSKERAVDVFVTHMEARVAEIRYQQFDEYAAFVAKHSDASRPVVMLGDFNTRGNPQYRQDKDSKYHLLLGKIAKALPDHRMLDVWPTLKSDKDGGTSEQEGKSGGRRIDYIFLAQPKEGEPELEAVDIRVNRFLDAKVDALSDHSAVEGDLRWGRK